MPGESERQLPHSLEAELDRLAPDLEKADIDPILLRRVAKGHQDAWSEILEVLYDQDPNFPGIRLITPFLLKLLSEPDHPLLEEILWTLASAREDPNTWAKTAAAAGFEKYLGFLAHPQPAIRRAA